MNTHKISFISFLILCSCFISSAQESYKIGEVYSIRENTSENPDINFAVEKMKSIPKAKLAIISYGIPGLAVRRINGIKTYYSKFFETNADEILAIYGGYDSSRSIMQKLRTELWIIPEKGAIPKTNFEYPTKPFLFDEFNWIVRESGYNFDNPFPFLVFADYLKRNPKDEARIIYYGYKDRYYPSDLSEARRRALSNKRKLTLSQVSSKRIKVLSGGYSKEQSHIEFWVLPHNTNSQNYFQR